MRVTAEGVFWFATTIAMTTLLQLTVMVQAVGR